MPYSAEISRANPTCFLFLIDQSRSMLNPMAGAPGKTRAEAVADAINHPIYTLVLRCVWGKGPHACVNAASTCFHEPASLQTGQSLPNIRRSGPNIRITCATYRRRSSDFQFGPTSVIMPDSLQ